MKDKSWITSLFLLLLMAVSVVVRLYFVMELMEDVGISEEIYHAAQIAGTDRVKLQDILSEGLSIKALYVYFLSVAFIIFGNYTVAGVYLNLIYQTVTVLFVFAAVKNISNREIGFGAALVLSVFPLYISQISRVTSFDLTILLLSLLLTAVTGILRVVLTRMKGRDTKTAENRTHSEEETSQTDADLQEDYVKPVMDTSLKEIRLDDLEDKKVQFIENPLPVPKRKAHKEMDFAVELNAENDDYDLKDLSEKDDFDIK